MILLIQLGWHLALCALLMLFFVARSRLDVWKTVTHLKTDGRKSCLTSRSTGIIIKILNFSGELITTVDGKYLLRYQGYCYTKKPRSRWYWRCIHTGNCFVTICVDDKWTVLKKPKQHLHPPKEFIKNNNGTYNWRNKMSWSMMAKPLN